MLGDYTFEEKLLDEATLKKLLRITGGFYAPDDRVAACYRVRELHLRMHQINTTWFRESEFKALRENGGDRIVKLHKHPFAFEQFLRVYLDERRPEMGLAACELLLSDDSRFQPVLLITFCDVKDDRFVFHYCGRFLTDTERNMFREKGIPN